MTWGSARRCPASRTGWSVAAFCSGCRRAGRRNQAAAAWAKTFAAARPGIAGRSASFTNGPDDDVQVPREVLEQYIAGSVLELRAEREVVAHLVLAGAHERPFVADQRDALLRSEPLFGRIAQLVQGAAS